MCDCVNPSDEHIAAVIEKLTDDIRFRGVRVGTEKFEQSIEAIAKLRASMEPTVIQHHH